MNREIDIHQMIYWDNLKCKITKIKIKDFNEALKEFMLNYLKTTDKQKD